jgi:hypothetical protein
VPDFADTRVSSLAGKGVVRGIALTAVASNACLVKVGGITVTARAATGLTVAAGTSC